MPSLKKSLQMYNHEKDLEKLDKLFTNFPADLDKSTLTCQELGWSGNNYFGFRSGYSLVNAMMHIAAKSINNELITLHPDCIIIRLDNISDQDKLTRVCVILSDLKKMAGINAMSWKRLKIYNKIETYKYGSVDEICFDFLDDLSMRRLDYPPLYVDCDHKAMKTRFYKYISNSRKEIETQIRKTMADDCLSIYSFIVCWSTKNKYPSIQEIFKNW
jgi:hypothetical protein